MLKCSLQNATHYMSGFKMQLKEILKKQIILHISLFQSALCADEFCCASFDCNVLSLIEKNWLKDVIFVIVRNEGKLFDIKSKKGP